MCKVSSISCKPLWLGCTPFSVIKVLLGWFLWINILYMFTNCPCRSATFSITVLYGWTLQLISGGKLQIMILEEPMLFISLSNQSKLYSNNLIGVCWMQSSAPIIMMQIRSFKSVLHLDLESGMRCPSLKRLLRLATFWSLTHNFEAICPKGVIKLSVWKNVVNKRWKIEPPR